MATPRLRTIASQSIVASEPTVTMLGPMFVPISVAYASCSGTCWPVARSTLIIATAIGILLTMFAPTAVPAATTKSVPKPVPVGMLPIGKAIRARRPE